MGPWGSLFAARWSSRPRLGAVRVIWPSRRLVSFAVGTPKIRGGIWCLTLAMQHGYRITSLYAKRPNGGPLPCLLTIQQ